ncbi:MAG: hypothetical protein JW774_01820, partial [Candidatus Aureabacteria bacterium]|nr:hypothetical protein [Candidatus Auribacterota bacterium]
DMNLQNNLENQSWKAFQDRAVCNSSHGNLDYFIRVSPAMKNADKQKWKNVQLLVHRPGTAVLLSPAAFSIEKMRWWAYLIVSTLTSLCVLGILLLAFSFNIPSWKAALLSFSVIISPPAVFYANQAFPEIPVAMLLTLSYLLCCSERFCFHMIACVLLMLTPWFSDRAIPAALIFALFCLIQARNNTERSALFMLILSGAVILAYYYYNRFGVIWPVHHNPRVSSSFSYILKGLPGFILDRNRGIIWLSPMLLFLPSVLYALYMQHKKFAVFLSFALGLSLINISSFPDWMGGVCPAGRYGVFFQILSLPAFLFWLKKNRSKKQVLFLSLLLIFGIIETLVLFNHPSWWYRKYHPLFAISFLQPLYTFLPDLQNPTYPEIIKALLWSGVFLFILIIPFYNIKSSMPTR